jgi:5,5'-dehydrodivanillate O-demethylase
MITREENERWTRVGPGTPAGEMLRHYWWPVAFADEVGGPRPKKVQLLGEEFVLFRDGSGRLGMIEPQCAHRRAPMEYGRVEQDGIRCCYHGWLWNAEGRCLETPCEDPGTPLKDRVKMAAYRVQEAAGLVFAYIGRKPAPLLPKYDLLMHNSGTRYVYGTTNHFNWFQAAENAADPPHLFWLHAGVYPMYAGKRPRVDYHERPYGLDFVLDLPDLAADKCSSMIFPCHNRFASARVEQPEPQQNMIFRVPRDDVTTLNFFITLVPGNDGKLVHKSETPPGRVNRPRWEHKVRGVYGQVDDGWWGVQSSDQDRMALEGQGPIYDRSRENLAPSDRGVAMLRRFLRESIDAVEAGRDPKGIIREGSPNPVLTFGTRLHELQPALATEKA